MSTPFLIRSNTGDSRLAIDGSVVQLTGRDLVAKITPYELEPRATARGLARFFKELARDWRGWVGVREFGTLEGEFGVSATHDGLGTVELRITLQAPVSEVSGSWQASPSIYIDAGSLSEIAREASTAR